MTFQNIPVTMLLDLEIHATVDILVTGRNVILVHNAKRAHLKQFLHHLDALEPP